jgi:transglutaminase-like putative cysteine protease
MVALIQEHNDIAEYLKASNIIDYYDNTIIRVAQALARNEQDEIKIVHKTYNFVRDKIMHSFDGPGNIVTCKASEVLKYQEGICYAKAHLLAALLRYLKIPTGFCYQKLILDDKKSPWLIIHGLNAVYFNSLGKWVRLDARGNNAHVNAYFSLDSKKIAFLPRQEAGEKNLPIIYAHPPRKIITSITRSLTLNELHLNLPTEL